MLARQLIWKQHPVYTSYEFSIYGGVRHKDGLPVTCSYTRKYLRCGKELRYKLLHILVLETFRGFRPRGMYGCHDNDNQSDNRLSNLKWKTPQQNVIDRYLNGYTHSATTRARMSASQAGNTNGAGLKGRPGNNPWGRAGKPAEVAQNACR